jgi:hypothetical protein
MSLIFAHVCFKVKVKSVPLEASNIKNFITIEPTFHLKTHMSADFIKEQLLSYRN